MNTPNRAILYNIIYYKNIIVGINIILKKMNKSKRPCPPLCEPLCLSCTTMSLNALQNLKCTTNASVTAPVIWQMLRYLASWNFLTLLGRSWFLRCLNHLWTWRTEQSVCLHKLSMELWQKISKENKILKNEPVPFSMPRLGKKNGG